MALTSLRRKIAPYLLGISLVVFGVVAHDVAPQLAHADLSDIKLAVTHTPLTKPYGYLGYGRLLGENKLQRALQVMRNYGYQHYVENIMSAPITIEANHNEYLMAVYFKRWLAIPIGTLSMPEKILAAILIHEAVHLDGYGEKEAYTITVSAMQRMGETKHQLYISAIAHLEDMGYTVGRDGKVVPDQVRRR